SRPPELGSRSSPLALVRKTPGMDEWGAERREHITAHCECKRRSPTVTVQVVRTETSNVFDRDTLQIFSRRRGNSSRDLVNALHDLIILSSHHGESFSQRCRWHTGRDRPIP